MMDKLCVFILILIIPYLYQLISALARQGREKGKDMSTTYAMVTDNEDRVRGYMLISNVKGGNYKVTGLDQFYTLKHEGIYSGIDTAGARPDIDVVIDTALGQMAYDKNSLTVRQIPEQEYVKSFNQYRAEVHTIIEEYVPDPSTSNSHIEYADKVMDEFKAYALSRERFPHKIEIYRESGIPDCLKIPSGARLMVDKKASTGQKVYYTELPNKDGKPKLFGSVAEAIAYARKEGGLAFERGPVTKAEMWAGEKDFNKAMLEASIKGASKETLYILSQLYQSLPNSSDAVVVSADPEVQRVAYGLVMSDIKEMADIVTSAGAAPLEDVSTADAPALGYSFMESEGYVQKAGAELVATEASYGIIGANALNAIGFMRDKLYGGSISVPDSFIQKLYKSLPNGTDIGYTKKDEDDRYAESKPGTFFVRDSVSGDIKYRDIQEFKTAIVNAERMSEAKIEQNKDKGKTINKDVSIDR